MWHLKKGYLVGLILSICVEAGIGIALGLVWGKTGKNFSSPLSIALFASIWPMSFVCGIFCYLAMTSGTVSCKELELDEDGKLWVEGRRGTKNSYKIRHVEEDESSYRLYPNKRLAFVFSKKGLDEGSKAKILALREKIRNEAS